MSAIPSSSAVTLPPPPPPPPPIVTFTNTKTTITQNVNKIGFGYAIAIAFGFLVLLSAIFLASYVCCRSAAARRRRRHESQSDDSPNPNFSPNETSVYLPRIIFVSEDENDDASNGNVAIGLDQAVINSYPKLRFSKRFGNGGVSCGNETVCAICLCEYKELEMLRLLPDCRHYFHVTCIDPWLKLNASCPVCRNSPLPTPLSTPLSEVVPLSQYAGGRRRS